MKNKSSSQERATITCPFKKKSDTCLYAECKYMQMYLKFPFRESYSIQCFIVGFLFLFT